MSSREDDDEWLNNQLTLKNKMLQELYPGMSISQIVDLIRCLEEDRSELEKKQQQEASKSGEQFDSSTHKSANGSSGKDLAEEFELLNDIESIKMNETGQKKIESNFNFLSLYKVISNSSGNFLYTLKVQM
jgi:hypothetical protein